MRISVERKQAGQSHLGKTPPGQAPYSSTVNQLSVASTEPRLGGREQVPVPVAASRKHVARRLLSRGQRTRQEVLQCYYN